MYFIRFKMSQKHAAKVDYFSFKIEKIDDM